MKPTAAQIYEAVRNHQCPTWALGARIWDVLVSDKAKPCGYTAQQVTLDTPTICAGLEGTR